MTRPFVFGTEVGPGGYSSSIVPGGFEVQS